MLTKKITITLLCVFMFGITTIITAKERFIFIGTYTDTIHVYSFNDQTGELKPISIYVGIKDASYLTHNRNFIYTISEKTDSVYALKIVDDRLKLINQISTYGNGPCYVDSYGNKIAVTNYSSGSYFVSNIASDGSLESPVNVVLCSGSSANTARQNKPYLHSARFTADGKLVFAADLGTDKLYIYDPSTNKQVAHINVDAGSGPRHFTFDHKKKLLYLLNEMSGTIDVFKYGNILVTSKLQQVESGLESDEYSVGIGSADIHITPNGKFLYASHRGISNVISIYSIQDDGKLRYVGKHSSEGKHPRNFVIDPSGKYLLVANKDTDNVVVMEINQESGLLTVVNNISISRPVCLKF